MRLKTVGARTILTERVWPAHLLLAVLGVGAMAMAWEGYRRGHAELAMVTLIGGLGMLMLVPNLGLGQTSIVFDSEQRSVSVRQQGLFAESRRLAYADIAEVAVITRDTDEGIDYQIAVRPTAGPDLRFGASADRSRVDALAATLRALL